MSLKQFIPAVIVGLLLAALLLWLTLGWLLKRCHRLSALSFCSALLRFVPIILSKRGGAENGVNGVEHMAMVST